jgi:hypothetical protein
VAKPLFLGSSGDEEETHSQLILSTRQCRPARCYSLPENPAHVVYRVFRLFSYWLYSQENLDQLLAWARAQPGNRCAVKLHQQEKRQYQGGRPKRREHPALLAERLRGLSLITMLPALEIEHLSIHLGQAYEQNAEWEKARATYMSLLAYAQEAHEPGMERTALSYLETLAAQQPELTPEVGQ